MSRTYGDRRSFLKGVGGAATAIGLAGCAGLGGDSGRDFFKLGAVTSLSGDLRFGGEVTQRGYDLWADTINEEQGGIEIGGETYEVQIEYADAQSKPSTGADAASQMIDEGADAVLGPYSSNVTLAVCPIMDQNSMPHISGSAESPQIWQEGFEYSFGTIPTVSIIGNEAASALLNLEPQPDSVYITAVNEPFSVATGDAMQAAAEEAGITVENYEQFPRDTDYTNVVSAAQNADPDLHLHGGHIGSHVNLVNAAEQLGYNPDGFLMHYGVNTGSYKDGAGAQAPYTFGATVWLPEVDREGGVLFDSPQAYADASQSAYDTAPDYTQAGSTAAGIVFQEAFKELGSAPPLSQDDKDELIGIIEEIEVNTFYGDVAFETEGEYYHNNVNTQPLLVQLGDDGSASIVGPEESATTEANYPVPAWDER